MQLQITHNTEKNQLELFPLNELDLLRLELRQVKESSDKVRKGIHAKHGDLAKKYLELLHEFEILKKVLCQK